MSNNHSLVYFVQFFLLTSMLILFSTSTPTIPVALTCFGLLFVSELFLVHQSTKMKDEAVLYKKGCFFALFDLLSAGIFIFYFFFFLAILIFKYSFEYGHWQIAGLFAYTLIRKIYIYKNYSYEK